jgi:UDP-glucuronate 4-epimerase
MGKLLVTGAMGHVGYETTKQAAALGLEVVAQYLSTFRKDDAEALGPNVCWAQCDLSNPYELAMLCADHDIYGCIHTAAIPNDTVGLPQPLRTFESNVVAVGLLLETARRRNWQRFLYVSTGSVYQDWKDISNPIPETAQPSPKTLYGCTKRSAELMVEAYANSYSLPAATVRISWIFGPPMVPATFDGPRGPIPEFLRRVLQGEEIKEPEGGDFAASFTYVPDCAKGLLTAYQAKKLSYRSYNLGSGKNQTTFEILDAICKVLPDAKITVGSGTNPWTQHATLRGPLSCERMKEDFNFTPSYSLEKAISEFASWMKSNPESYRN